MNVRNLNKLEMEGLDQSRKLALRLMNATTDFTTNAFDQAYADVLENTASNILFQSALGIALGDLILSKSDYIWLRVEDKYGEETAVGLPDPQIVCYPISIIQKRLASKERMDSAQLVRSTISAMEEMRISGEYRSN
ncbi:DUF3806 domain-containing protein [Algimonas porphyrae]|uniref:DUF3806 domain-containing protein n=1 Tax=Algimonas porphyrae TaxID=1128113 RepID=A0ABQ5UZ77_9PROT|nr:DUF3806 domain-containing protein [Algimonas porphyrae]GLQ20214.1 hypothetical protein GCM10007854_11690 [Algimonas porphyrae]